MREREREEEERSRKKTSVMDEAEKTGGRTQKKNLLIIISVLAHHKQTRAW